MVPGRRLLPGEIVVFYDVNGLEAGEGSSKLDIRLVPVHHPHGVFHPKTVLISLQSKGEQEERGLAVLTMSANLTKSGWWENVECAHLEFLRDGEKTGLRDGLLSYLTHLAAQARVFPKATEAIRDVRRFVRRLTPYQRRIVNRQLTPRFWDGGDKLIDFLAESLRGQVKGMNLDVISPYFDDDPACEPLNDLISHLRLSKVRVFLPRENTGEALVGEEYFDAVSSLPNTSWAVLPTELTALGKDSKAGSRFVHAKVYRFWSRRTRREILLVGSPNLTRPGHGGKSQNREAAILVEVECRVPPRSWLTPLDQPPPAFEPVSEAEEGAKEGGFPLSLVFDWEKETLTARWLARKQTPPDRLCLIMQGNHVGDVVSLQRDDPMVLPPEMAQQVADELKLTSFAKVLDPGSDSEGDILIQEEGLHRKPYMVVELTAEEILRYWALLTVEQRAAFLEQRTLLRGDLSADALDITTRTRGWVQDNNIFAEMAGIFHAFRLMEQSVEKDIERGNERNALWRLFGEKYDSLTVLLNRLENEDEGWDPLARYVTVLCAEQVISALEEKLPDFMEAHRKDIKRLRKRLSIKQAFRRIICKQDRERLEEFLEWFEPLFLKRFQPVEVER